MLVAVPATPGCSRVPPCRHMVLQSTGRTARQHRRPWRSLVLQSTVTRGPEHCYRGPAVSSEPTVQGMCSTSCSDQWTPHQLHRGPTQTIVRTEEVRPVIASARDVAWEKWKSAQAAALSSPAQLNLQNFYLPPVIRGCEPRVGGHRQWLYHNNRSTQWITLR